MQVRRPHYAIPVDSLSWVSSESGSRPKQFFFGGTDPEREHAHAVTSDAYLETGSIPLARRAILEAEERDILYG